MYYQILYKPKINILKIALNLKSNIKFKKKKTVKMEGNTSRRRGD